VPAVVRGLVERRLPQLIMAGSAGDHRVPHASSACCGFRAGAQMHGFQLTCTLPGQSWWPNGQHSGLFSNRETGI
jgi:hypothetical protein